MVELRRIRWRPWRATLTPSAARAGLWLVAWTALGLATGVVGWCGLELAIGPLLGGLAATVGFGLSFAPSVDPIYTRAALGTLAHVSFAGLAVAGPIGAALHAWQPGTFADPSLASGLPARLALASDSAVLANLIAASLTSAVLMAAALLLLRHGLASQRLSMLGVAVGLQVQLALGVAGLPPSLADLEAAGVSFAVTAAFPFLGRRTALSDLVAGWPAALVSGLLVALALLSAYLLGAALVLFCGWLARAATGSRSKLTRWIGRPSVRSAGFSALVAFTLTSGAAATVASQVAAYALNARAPLARPVMAAQAVVDPVPAAGSTETVTATTVPARTMAASPGPTAPGRIMDLTGPARASVVTIQQVGPGSYQYLVNGEPQVINGMGLNTQYATQMDPAARAQRLDADFAEMQSMGVNTVLGWDPAEFDATLLGTANRYGIGVVLPFALNPAADYTDPAYRARLTARVLAWVRQYRNEPSLRMWGLGNEVLHGIVHPAWVGQQDPASNRNAQAFADWLIATADAIHQVDPNHPVTYREAEDAFTPWIATAIQHTHQVHPWFVFGTNCYTDRLKDIINTWPDRGIDGPLWVSEFAPGGEAPAQRGAGFTRMWGYIRAQPGRVLGGAVYAWTQNGPEEIDRTLGLTHDGVPVAQDWLDTLSLLFHADDGLS